MTRVITAVEMQTEDISDFKTAREALRRILNRRLDAVWTFKDKENPTIEFEGVRFLYPPKELEK